MHSSEACGTRCLAPHLSRRPVTADLLRYAIEKHYVGLVTLLVDRGADLYAKWDKGLTTPMRQIKSTYSAADYQEVCLGVFEAWGLACTNARAGCLQYRLHQRRGRVPAIRPAPMQGAGACNNARTNAGARCQ